MVVQDGDNLSAANAFDAAFNAATAAAVFGLLGGVSTLEERAAEPLASSTHAAAFNAASHAAMFGLFGGVDDAEAEAADGLAGLFDSPPRPRRFWAAGSAPYARNAGRPFGSGAGSSGAGTFGVDTGGKARGDGCESDGPPPTLALPSGTTMELWVRCEEPPCLKWRKIPAAVSDADIPAVFRCDMNRWDLFHSSCSVPEEIYDATFDATAVGDANAAMDSTLSVAGGGKKRKKAVPTAEEMEQQRERRRLTRQCGRCGERGHMVNTCVSTSHVNSQKILEGNVDLCVRCDRPMHVHEYKHKQDCTFMTRVGGARIGTTDRKNPKAAEKTIPRGATLRPWSTGSKAKPVEGRRSESTNEDDWEHYASHTAAARKCGINVGSVSQCVIGKQSEAGGFKFRYAKKPAPPAYPPPHPPPPPRPPSRKREFAKRDNGLEHMKRVPPGSFEVPQQKFRPAWRALGGGWRVWGKKRRTGVHVDYYFEPPGCPGKVLRSVPQAKLWAGTPEEQRNVDGGGGSGGGSGSGSSNRSGSGSGSSNRSVSIGAMRMPDVQRHSAQSDTRSSRSSGSGGSGSGSNITTSSIADSGTGAATSVVRRGDTVKVAFGLDGICDCAVFKVTASSVCIRDKLTNHRWSETIHIRDWEEERFVSVIKRVKWPWTRSAAIARSGRDHAYEHDLFSVVDVEGKGRGVRYVGNEPIPKGVDILEYTGGRKGTNGNHVGGGGGDGGGGGGDGYRGKCPADAPDTESDTSGSDGGDHGDSDDDGGGSNSSLYAFRLQGGGEIDGRTGGIARLLNHGFYREENNCLSYEEEDRIFFRTTRPIVRGEELTYYYSDDYDAQLRAIVGIEARVDYSNKLPSSMSMSMSTSAKVAAKNQGNLRDATGGEISPNASKRFCSISL
jgi:hypothetical protein